MGSVTWTVKLRLYQASTSFPSEWPNQSGFFLHLHEGGPWDDLRSRSLGSQTRPAVRSDRWAEGLPGGSPWTAPWVEAKGERRHRSYWLIVYIIVIIIFIFVVIFISIIILVDDIRIIILLIVIITFAPFVFLVWLIKMFSFGIFLHASDLQ